MTEDFRVTLVNDLSSKLSKELYGSLRRTLALVQEPIVDHPVVLRVLILGLVSRTITRLMAVHMLENCRVREAVGDTKPETVIWFAAFLMARMAINPDTDKAPTTLALEDLKHWKASGGNFGSLPDSERQFFELITDVIRHPNIDVGDMSL